MPTSAEPYSVFAPGKLLILGEYAVLDGAPALVLAIDRGVRCDVDPNIDFLQIDTPDGDTRFVHPALRHLTHGSFRFSHWNPPDIDGKPGFGGSAAACVAACVAAHRPATDAIAIHRDVQGSGSGADVTAAIAGGMIRFQQGEWHPVPPVHPVVIWSGQSAKTGPRVEHFLRWPDRHRFAQESESLVDHFQSDPIEALRAAMKLLRAMEAATRLDYMTPNLETIVELAESCGGAAKPSGAGGGDCAIALFPERSAEEAFKHRLLQKGLQTIPIQPAMGAECSTTVAKG